MNRQEELGNAPVGRLLIKFSIPAIIGMVVATLYNIVDRIYIGKLGTMAMAGIGLNLPIMTILMAFGMLIGIGAAALISIRLGQQRKDEAEHILGNAVSLLVIIMAILMVVGLFFKIPLLKMFGASEETIKYADSYITIILLGAIPNGVGFGINNIIRSEGNPKIAMYTMLLGAGLNIILDPIFIFVLKMGVAGAAVATVISQLANMIWVINYFTSGKSLLKLKVSNMKNLKWTIARDITAIGMSPFFIQFAASVVGVISNNALRTHGGDLAISAMTVVNAISMIFLMPIFGINQGAQPIIGFNYGAKNFHRVKKALSLAILGATMFSTVGFLLVELFPELLIRVFNDDPKLMEITSSGMRMFLMMMPVIGFQIVTSNYFQAVGKAKMSMFLSLLRQVLILIPALLILPGYLGLKGIWISQPLADGTASLITAFLLWKEFKEVLWEKKELPA